MWEEGREGRRRGEESLNQEREGEGVPAGLQSRVSGLPWRPVVAGGRDTLGGSVGRGGREWWREGGREGEREMWKEKSKDQRMVGRRERERKGGKENE